MRGRLAKYSKSVPHSSVGTLKKSLKNFTFFCIFCQEKYFHVSPDIQKAMSSFSTVKLKWAQLRRILIKPSKQMALIVCRLCCSFLSVWHDNVNPESEVGTGVICIVCGKACWQDALAVGEWLRAGVQRSSAELCLHVISRHTISHWCALCIKGLGSKMKKPLPLFCCCCFNLIIFPCQCWVKTMRKQHLTCPLCCYANPPYW